MNTRRTSEKHQWKWRPLHILLAILLSLTLMPTFSFAETLKENEAESNQKQTTEQQVVVVDQKQATEQQVVAVDKKEEAPVVSDESNNKNASEANLDTPEKTIILQEVNLESGDDSRGSFPLLTTDFVPGTDVTIKSLSVSTPMATDSFYTVSFGYELKVPGSQVYVKNGDTITIPTNLGDLFVTGPAAEDTAFLSSFPLYDNGTIIGTVTYNGTSFKIVFNAAAEAKQMTSVSGTISTGDRLKPIKEKGSESPGTDQTINIGGITKAVKFVVPSSSGNTNRELDWNSLWKNAFTGTTNNMNYLEVNPEATNVYYENLGESLVRSSSNGPQGDVSKKNVIVEDKIPGKGVIRESSFRICGVIAQFRIDDAGKSHAKSAGTDWVDATSFFTKITQTPGESYDAFKARVTAAPLSYGIHTDSDKNQTIVANFGDLPGNGLTYDDIYAAAGKNVPFNFLKTKDVLSYHVEFTADYPEILYGKVALTNTATVTFTDAKNMAQTAPRSASFTISPGGGVGLGEKGTMTVFKYDAASVNKNPGDSTKWAKLAGAKFKLQKKDGDTWSDYSADGTTTSGVTDSNGKLELGVLPDGTYRLVETEAPANYDINNSTYLATSDSAGPVTEGGEFVIKTSDLLGYGAIVLNSKKEYTVSWATSEGGSIAPASETEKVTHGGNATKIVTPTATTGGDPYVFAGWSYKYLPDGSADTPANYVSGLVPDYKTVPVAGNVTFTATFTKKPVVTVTATNGYANVAKGSTPSALIGDPKPSSGSVTYDSVASSGEQAAFTFEANTHYSTLRITVTDKYTNTKKIYTTAASETADTTFVMNSSTLGINLSSNPTAGGTLIISNIKNSLDVTIEFSADSTYKVNFYSLPGDTTPHAKNENLYTGDNQGSAPATNPTRVGWTFGGWSYDGTSAQPYNPNNKINGADVNVYAIWSSNTYTVNYNLSGGTLNGNTSAAAKSATYGEAGLLPTGTLAKTGYDFNSWKKDSTTVTATTKYSDLVADDTVMSVTLVAGWDAHHYNVVFNKNATDATGTMTDQSFTYDQAQALTGNGFSRTGYNFAGWALTANGPVAYANLASVSNLSAVDDAEVPLYAVWNANGDTPYKVEHYQQQPDGTFELAETNNLTAATASSVSATPYTQDDAGWEDFVYHAGNASTVSSSSVAANGSTVLKLYYQRLETVSFDMNGGTEPTVGQFDDQRVIWGDSATHPGAPEKTGYTFVGWEDENGDVWDFASEVNSSFTLSAAYEANSYQVAFDKAASGATGTMANQTFKFDVAQKLTANAYTNSGYHFLGWATTAGGPVVYTDTQEVINLTNVDGSTVTVYAVWEADPQDTSDNTSTTSGGGKKGLPTTGDLMFGVCGGLLLLAVASFATLLVSRRRRERK